MEGAERDGGFAIYVHWPFCQAKCPYCDFNSHVTAHVDQGRWRAAFSKEVERFQDLTEGRQVDSVYFGGGTPSLMESETVATILGAIQQAWPVANDWEVTLEANPTSVEANRFEAYRAAGVNRVSLGVQSLRDDDLKRLGRLHSAAEAKAAFGLAREVFDRVSFDLIYARQDQSLADWESELEEALDLTADHLSLYQLTIEPGTAFWERHRSGGLRGLPEEDLAADLYEKTVSKASEHGLRAYEVSNLARDGAQSKHNMVYWSAGEYLGLGPGAHGRLRDNEVRFATEARRAPGDWLQSVEDGSSVETWTALDAEDQLAEYLMMGLRTTQGIRRDWVLALGPDPDFWDRLGGLEENDLVTQTKDRIRCTPKGRIVLNAVLRELLV